MFDSNTFLEALDRKAGMFAPAARAAVESNPAVTSWLLDPLARWTGAAFGGRAFDDAASGYARYCLGVWKCQQQYEKSGRYEPQAMPDVVANVYENEEFMIPYLWGVLLIYAYWPSMTSHLALYRDEFIKAVPRGGRVLELASGHGVLGMMAAANRPDIRVDGFDISPPAVAVSHRLLKAAGLGDRVKFEAKDALNLSLGGAGKTYSGIVAAMLAEHLLDPRHLFKVLAHHLSDDGLVFFSTALESAQRDHTYEFHRESEVVLMAEEAGFRVTRMVCDAGSPVPGGRFVPRALGMILRRR